MNDYGDIEPIVRRFCEIKGIDPDGYAPIPCPDGMPGCCVAHFGPAWKAYEGQVREGMALIEAIGFGLNGTTKAACPVHSEPGRSHTVATCTCSGSNGGAGK